VTNKINPPDSKSTAAEHPLTEGIAVDDVSVGCPQFIVGPPDALAPPEELAMERIRARMMQALLPAKVFSVPSYPEEPEALCVANEDNQIHTVLIHVNETRRNRRIDTWEMIAPRWYYGGMPFIRPDDPDLEYVQMPNDNDWPVYYMNPDEAADAARRQYLSHRNWLESDAQRFWALRRARSATTSTAICGCAPRAGTWSGRTQRSSTRC
jgi:hypothetical protein